MRSPPSRLCLHEEKRASGVSSAASFSTSHGMSAPAPKSSVLWSERMGSRCWQRAAAWARSLGPDLARLGGLVTPAQIRRLRTEHACLTGPRQVWPGAAEPQGGGGCCSSRVRAGASSRRPRFNSSRLRLGLHKLRRPLTPDPLTLDQSVPPGDEVGASTERRCGSKSA